MSDQERPTPVYFEEPVKEFEGDIIYWRYRTGGYLPEDGGSYGRCATHADANLILLKRKIAGLEAESDALAERIAELEGMRENWRVSSVCREKQARIEELEAENAKLREALLACKAAGILSVPAYTLTVSALAEPNHDTP